MSGDEYAQGGYIPGGPILTTIHADECLMKPLGARPGSVAIAVCIRGDHPTPTSDCTRLDWIRHASEETE